MPLPAVVAGLAVAGRLALSLARNPAVRRAAVKAAQKAGRLFSKTKNKAKQCCDKLKKGGGQKSAWTKDKKIADQMKKRGWDDDLVNDTINNPHRTAKTFDTRYRPDGSGLRNNDPATAYIRKDNSYVVRNNKTGQIVQVSNRNNPGWKSPF